MVRLMIAGPHLESPLHQKSRYSQYSDPNSAIDWEANLDISELHI